MSPKRGKKKKKSFRPAIRINGEIIRTTFHNKEDAEEWLGVMRRRKRRIEAGLEDLIQFCPKTIKEYAAIFMKKRVARNRVVRGTWVQDGQRLKDYILPCVGKKMMHAMTAENWEATLDYAQENPAQNNRFKIDRAGNPVFDSKGNPIPFYKKKMERLSNNTRNKIRACLHTMYEEALEDKVVSFNPIKKVVVLDIGDPESKVRFWETMDECEKYMSIHLERAYELKNFSWHTQASWMLGGGLRYNELTCLRHGDVDEINRRVRINAIYDAYEKKDVERTKASRVTEAGRTRVSRWLYLDKAMWESYLLLKRYTLFDQPDHYVFLNSNSEKKGERPGREQRLLLNSFCRVHYKLIEKANLKKINVHGLRHTFAAMFLTAGGSLRTLQKLLGHKSIVTTEKSYGHLTKSFLEQEAGRIQIGKVKKEDVTELANRISLEK